MKPLGRRLLIRHAKKGKFFDKEELLVIPEKYRGTANEGIVISLGTEFPNDELDPDGIVQPGSRVLFQKRSGQIVNVGEQRLKIIHWDDLLAVVEVGTVVVCPACQGQGCEVPEVNIGDPTTDDIGG